MPLGWPTPVVWHWSLALAKPAGHTLSSIKIFQTWPFYTESYQIFHCVWTKGCSSAVLHPPLNLYKSFKIYHRQHSSNIVMTFLTSRTIVGLQSRAVRLIEIEIKSWFELARFLNRFIARFFLRTAPTARSRLCYPNQSEQHLNWAREQNRPGTQTDSMLKKQGRWVQNRIRTWWPGGA